MRDMKDTGVAWIGAIPSKWPLVRFKDKYANTKEIAKERSVEFERLALTLNGVIKRPKDDSEGLQPKEFDGYQILRENDFVFKMIDLQNVSTSRVGLSTYTGLVSPAYIRFSPKKPNQYNQFVYYYLMSLYYNCVYNNLGGNGVRSALNAKDMGEFLVPYPDEAEQHRICAFLDKKCTQVDTLIANVQAQIEKLKTYKQSLITEVVTKGLDPNVPMKDSGVDYLGRIPSGWSIISIGQAFTYVSGFAFKSELFTTDETQYQVLRIGNVKNDNLILDNKQIYVDRACAESAKVAEVHIDDILFTMTGTKGKHDYFYTLLVNENHTSDRHLFINQRVGLFRAKSSKIKMAFANYVLKEKRILDYIFLSETGTANQGNIGIENIARTKLYLPSLAEQEQIVSYLDEKCSQIDRLIALKEEKIEKLEQYKHSLIYECVTGKREVA